jgi:hypothetical protein
VDLVVAVAAGEVEHGREAVSEQDVLARVPGDSLVAVRDGGCVGIELVDTVPDLAQRDVARARYVAFGVVARRATSMICSGSPASRRASSSPGVMSGAWPVVALARAMPV